MHGADMAENGMNRKQVGIELRMSKPIIKQVKAKRTHG